MSNSLPEWSQDRKLNWLASQSDFITFVEIMTVMSSNPEENGVEEIVSADNFFEKVDLMGELFLYLVDIDISPYPDFHTMRMVVPHAPDFITQLLNHITEEAVLKDAIKDTGVEPSLESQVDARHAMIMGYEMVRKMSLIVELPSETEKRYRSLGMEDILGPLRKPDSKNNEPEN